MIKAETISLAIIAAFHWPLANEAIRLDCPFPLCLFNSEPILCLGDQRLI